MKEWNLKNKTALVTGGSKGIGKATVAELLSLGAKVLVTARNKEELSATKKEFEAQGHSIDIMEGDIADAQHRDEVYNHILTTWGRLDILVNNAGINLRKSSIDYTEDEIMQVIGIDLLAPYALCRRLFGLLQHAKGASIINVASIAGLFDMQTGSPYGMAKSGIIQMSRNLAQEWAPFQIRVNAVSPGFTETPLTKGLLAQEEKRTRILSRTPSGRIGVDEEIAAVISFLAMEKSSYVTGQNIIVDGGITSGML